MIKSRNIRSTTIPFLFFVLAAAVLFSGCSVKKLVLKKAAHALSSGSGTVFSGDNDPLLIKDALPFALKTHESLLESLPENVELLTATGKAFCMYSYAFIQMPADTLGDDMLDLKDRKLRRAKKMYLRAKGYLFRALEVKHPGFTKLIDSGDIDSAIAMTTIEDTSILYWAGNSWFGAITTDIFDFTISIKIKRAAAIMKRVLELCPEYGNGSIHDFFISYYGSLPASMGGDKELAREHFENSIKLSNGANAAPYVSYATSVLVPKQDEEEFTRLLKKALRIDLDKAPENRLANIITQQKARWYLDHKEDFFLEP